MVENNTFFSCDLEKAFDKLRREDIWKSLRASKRNRSNNNLGGEKRKSI